MLHRDYRLIIKLLSRATATANTCLPAIPTPDVVSLTHARTHARAAPVQTLAYTPACLATSE